MDSNEFSDDRTLNWVITTLPRINLNQLNLNFGVGPPNIQSSSSTQFLDKNKHKAREEALRSRSTRKPLIFTRTSQERYFEPESRTRNKPLRSTSTRSSNITHEKHYFEPARHGALKPAFTTRYNTVHEYDSDTSDDTEDNKNSDTDQDNNHHEHERVLDNGSDVSEDPSNNNENQSHHLSDAASSTTDDQNENCNNRYYESEDSYNEKDPYESDEKDPYEDENAYEVSGDEHYGETVSDSED